MLEQSIELALDEIGMPPKSVPAYGTVSLGEDSTEKKLPKDAALQQGTSLLCIRRISASLWSKATPAAVDAVGVVVLSALHHVFIKYMTILVANYPTALTLHSVFWTVPSVLPYCLIQWKRGQLTPANLLPLDRDFIGISALVAIGSMLIYYSSRNTSGPLQTLLSQCVIPYSMLLSWVHLGTRYSCHHYVGVVIVVAGICVAIGREFVQDMSTGGAWGYMWIAVLLLAYIPFAALTVYLEVVYRRRPLLDPLYFSLLLSTFQMPFLLLLSLPSVYLSQPPMALAQLPRSLWQGTLCLCGINSQPSDNCRWAPVVFVVHIFVTIMVIIPFFRLPRTGGSDLLWVCSALKVPLANLAFSLPFLPQSVPVSWGNCLALVIICLGILVYGVRMGSCCKEAGAWRSWRTGRAQSEQDGHEMPQRGPTEEEEWKDKC